MWRPSFRWQITSNVPVELLITASENPLIPAILRLIPSNWVKTLRRLLPPTPTEDVRHVFILARKEADRFNHNYVGTEHLLLGLIKLGQGVAVNVLQKMNLELENVRQEVEKQVGTGPETQMVGNIPYTPRVKKVLALAGKEAKALNHSYVGTEHILLGLLREGEGVAARVLKSLEVDIERTRNEILARLRFDDLTPGRS